MTPRVAALLLVLLAIAFATEEDSIGSQLQARYKADFAVPDIPAFLALGEEPSELLRPSDPKSFALMVADQTSNFSLIPRSFAAEFAPIRLLAAKSITIEDYRKGYALYNTRISIGSRRNDPPAGDADVGLGLRVTLLNRGEFAFDRKLDSALTPLFHEADSLMEAFKLAYFRARPELSAEDMDDDANRYADSAVSELLDARIAAQRDSHEMRKWNAAVVDFAYAGLFTSPDSLTRNIETASHSAWLTWGFPVLGSLGQGLVGASASYTRPNDTWVLSYSGACRLYGGANNLKMFLEGQFKHDGPERSDLWLLQGGTEFRFMSGAWLEFNLAWENEFGGGSRLVPNLKCHFTLPEGFSAF